MKLGFGLAGPPQEVWKLQVHPVVVTVEAMEEGLPPVLTTEAIAEESVVGLRECVLYAT